MDKPFDDPTVKEMMAKYGIVHKPGLAAETLADIAPLLADEGIDIERPDNAPDIDAFNSALQRAIARHNFELFTPVGRQYEQSLAVLSEFVTALADHDIDAAQAVLSAVEPEPSDDHPAISHVIGAGLGRLDDWCTDRRLPTKRTVLVPTWSPSSRRVAREILRLAKEHQAFDCLNQLIIGFDGSQTFEGTALAVAAVILAVASSRNVPAADVIAQLLTKDAKAHSAETSEPAFSKTSSNRPQAPRKHPSGHPATRNMTTADRAAIRGFRAWLSGQAEIAAPTVDDEIRLFTDLIKLMGQNEASPHRPSDVEELIDGIIGAEDADQDTAFAVVNTMHDYVMFQLETSQDIVWNDVHATVDSTLELFGPNPLIDAMRASDALDPAERRATFAATKIVTTAPSILRWIGSSRKVTSTGGVLRADIAEVAAMLGISAVGVAKDPSMPLPSFALPDAAPPEVRVMTMRDLPVLWAWWQALDVAELTRLTASRVRPGPAAADWLDDPAAQTEIDDLLISAFVSELLTYGIQQNQYFCDQVFAHTINRLTEIVSPGATDETDATEQTFLAGILEASTTRTLQDLQFMGLVGTDNTGDFTVPPLLRGTVIRGMIMAADLITQLTASDLDEQEE